MLWQKLSISTTQYGTALFSRTTALGSVDLLLARHKISAATLVTFEEPLIDIAVARLMACRAKAPWGDLHRLPSILMKYYRHIVVRALHLCYGHGLSPLYWGAASVQSYQFLTEAVPPLLEVLDRN